MKILDWATKLFEKRKSNLIPQPSYDKLFTGKYRKGKKPPRVTRRFANSRERAWHKLFGGIACPPYTD